MLVPPQSEMACPKRRSTRLRLPVRHLASGGFRLTLGYYRWGRGLADRVFADWRFTDGPLTNWRGLDNRLRMREVCSNRRSHQSQRSTANYYEFQHDCPPFP